MLVFYTVKPGDSLFSLAESFSAAAGEIKTMNGIEDIVPGQRIIIVSDDPYPAALSGNTILTEIPSEETLLRVLKVLYPHSEPEPKPEPTPQPEPKPNCPVHVVLEGETLASIAVKHNTTPAILRSFNNLNGPITPGMELCVPKTPENSYIYTIRVGDTPEKIAGKFGISTERLLKVNYIKTDEKLLAGQQMLISV